MSRIEESINSGFAKKYKATVMRQRVERLKLTEKQIKDITKFIKENKDKLSENLSLSYNIGRLTYNIILAETPRVNMKIMEFENAVSILMFWKGMPIGCIFSDKDKAAEIEPNSSYLLVGVIFRQKDKKNPDITYTKLQVYGLITSKDLQEEVQNLQPKRQQQQITKEIEEFYTDDEK